MAIKLKDILENIGLQRKTGVGSRYRAIVKRGDKYYYVQDDPLGNNIRQEFGPYSTKAQAKKKMETFPPAKNYRDIKEEILVEKKLLSIFDFDDTLAKSDSWVYVMMNGVEVEKLDPAEFAVHRLEKGQEYDFRDFDKKLRNPKIIKKNVDLLRKQLKKGGRKVTILTARRLGAPINHFFKTIGIQPYVVPLGDANPQKKADYIETEILKGYDPIYFMDDSPKNIKAVNKLRKKYPDTTIITKLVK